MSSTDAKALAKKLLDQHVEHELSNLTGKQLLKELEKDVKLVFKAAEAVRLRDIITPDTINGIIYRHTVERDMPAIIPEMAADFTMEVVQDPVHKNTTPGDIISRDHVEEFTDQALLLKEQRDQLIERILEQPVYKEMIANVVYEGIARYVYEENLISKKVPGVSSALKFGSKMLNKAVTGLDEAWEKSVKGYISNNVETLAKFSAQFLRENLTDDELKVSVMDAWDSFSKKRLESLQKGLGEIEWNEFIVIGYDFWLSFRKTDYYRHCYETVVESLFQQYGDYSLATLADELNITEETVMTEAEAVLPRAMDTLKENGLLEKLLRRRLKRFYESKGVLETLQG